MRAIGVLFPFQETQQGGVFKPAQTTDESLRSDMIALLTLKRGNRPMQSRMYSPIWDYIFEPLDDISKNELENKIKEKVREFVPQVEVKKIQYTPKPENNLLGIKIFYNIKEYFDSGTQSIELNIPTQI